MNSQLISRVAFVLFLISILPVKAQAHFLWLVTQADEKKQSQLHLFFSELAEGDDPALLKRVAKVKVFQIDSAGTEKGIAKPLKLKLSDDSLTVAVDGDSSKKKFFSQHDFGVMTRGGETFLLRYYAKTGPAVNHSSWKQNHCDKYLDYHLIPLSDGKHVTVKVLHQGKPVARAQVVVSGPGLDGFEANSNEKGIVEFKIAGKGVYSIRARHIEKKKGKANGKEYHQIRHYTTLAVNVPFGSKISKTPIKKATKTKPKLNYPDLPELVTSFGAAIEKDVLYVYGGHTGDAHEYYLGSQANTLRRLDLKNPKKWETVNTGPRIQGLAMVAHQGKLYRIGGFSAKNKEGDDHDLWSQADVACFDLATKKWTNIAPLPEPRSSFDAAVLNDKLYVIGGWKLHGKKKSTWHKTSYVMDLSAKKLKWVALPEQPFMRRALSLAAYNNKIYAIGGMRPKGGPCTNVSIYDPKTKKWSTGPNLQGKAMEGFGSSAFATGGRLYVSTFAGNLQRLSKDGKTWQTIKKLERARFFHRMLPLSDNQLISVGGASMKTGKFDEVDIIEVEK